MNFDGNGIKAYVEEHLEYHPYVVIETKTNEPYRMEESLTIENKEDAERLIKVLQYYLGIT